MGKRDCIFWGKFKEDGDCLPLACHCLDVALAPPHPRGSTPY